MTGKQYTDFECPMGILGGLTRLLEVSRVYDELTSDASTHNSQLHLEANDLGHCAVYEKELQRVWPISEENRKAKIAEFAEKQGFRLAYYQQGHCAIFLKDYAGRGIGTRENRRGAP